MRWFGGCVTLVAVVLGGCAPKATTSNTPTLTALEVKLSREKGPKGQPIPIIATAVHSDGTRSDVSVHTTWGTSAPFVATINCTATSCTVITINVGQAILTASYEGLSTTATATVEQPKAVTLEASASEASLVKGTSIYVSAVSEFSDTSTYDVTATSTWTSSDDTIAAVTCPEGICSVTGLGLGMVTLTAAFDGLTATVDLDVTQPMVNAMALSEAMLNLGVGEMKTLVATGTFTDQTMGDVSSLATWSSSNQNVATVVGGVVTGVAGGQATITASMGIRSASLTVVVQANQTGVAITTENPTVPLGSSFQLHAEGLFEGNVRADVTGAATWSSSDTEVAEISAGGLVTTGHGRPMGTTTITVEHGGFTDTTVLTVGEAAPASVTIGPVADLHANDAPFALRTHLVDTNGVTRAPEGTVTFAVSNEAIATVDAGGLLTPKTMGTVTVTATAEGVSGTRVVTIGGALLSVIVSPMELTLQLGGDAKTVKAAGFYQGAASTQPLTEGVTWDRSNSAVYIIPNPSNPTNPAEKLVGCNSAGTATITATVNLSAGAQLSGQATVTCE